MKIRKSISITDELPSTLIPYDAREAISVRAAAKQSGRCPATIKAWCHNYHIGRRVMGGNLEISRPALAMAQEGQWKILDLYLAGDRSSPEICRFYHGLGLGNLLEDLQKRIELEKDCGKGGQDS